MTAQEQRPGACRMQRSFDEVRTQRCRSLRQLFRPVFASLLHSQSRDVRPALMQHELVHLPVRILDEGELCIDNLQEELQLGFRENRKLRLVCRLDEQRCALAGYGNLKVGCELIDSDERLELRRIQRNFLALLCRLGRSRERNLWLQDVKSD